MESFDQFSLFPVEDSDSRETRAVSKGSSLENVYDERQSLDVKHILQPRTLTYACYRFSKLHRSILVHIREELQAYISNSLNDINANELITVPLFVSHYPSLRGNGAALFESVSKMMPNAGNIVYFEWKFNTAQHTELFQWMQRGVKGGGRMAMPKDGAIIQETSAIIVKVVHCDNDPGKVIVSINPSVLPFLLYYGPGVGGTVFDRDIALKLPSSYSARIYEMVADWSTSCSVKTIGLGELRKRLVISSKYDVNDIRMRVLDVAKREMEQTGSPVQFDYRLKYDSSFGVVTGKRGRYPANCVEFIINKKEYIDWSELSRKQVLVMLQGIADRECFHLCEPLARQVVENGQDGKLKSKFSFYDGKVTSGSMTPLEYKNTLLKIVRELTGVDLRSGRHIRNAVRTRHKYSGSSREPVLIGEAV